MESLTLTTPISLTTYQVERLILDWGRAQIQVLVKASNGDRISAEYLGAPATTLMIALNKANLSTQSLHARILNQLVTDGKLPAGSITGTPD